jgi:transposase
VYDGGKPYWCHATCRNAPCNIHHLRVLTFLEEHYGQSLANERKDLMRQKKAATEHARSSGASSLPQADWDRFVVRYERLLATGLAANPPPVPSPRHRGRRKQSPARSRLERLWRGRAQVRAFLDDLTIPYDDNQAECDPRIRKTQQNFSGCFRSAAGAERSSACAALSPRSASRGGTPRRAAHAVDRHPPLPNLGEHSSDTHRERSSVP